MSALFQPLDALLGSPASVRVLRVLAGHGGSLGLSDIARRARLSLPGSRAALQRLREWEVVTVMGAGRSLVCGLAPDHPLTPALQALFAAEREHADGVLNSVRQAAAELDPPPLAVWLYGSVARGVDQPTSDVDVALVSAQAEPALQAEALRAAVAVSQSGRRQRISIIALGPADVQRLAGEGAKLWRELERDAVVLAGDAPAGVLERVRGAGDRA